MVVDSNTVVQPGAVVVEPLDADIADVAMTRPRGLDDLTVRAELSGIEFLQQGHEVKVRILLKLTRVFTDSHDVRDEHFDADHRG